jgi:hypothetical protein
MPTVSATTTRTRHEPTAGQKNLDQLVGSKTQNKTQPSWGNTHTSTPKPVLAQASGTKPSTAAAPSQSTDKTQTASPASSNSLQAGAAGVRGGAYGSFEPSFRDFSSKPLKPLQKFMNDSPGNRLVDGAGRDKYNATTKAKANEVLSKIDSGKISAREGAYEAATYRDAQTLKIRDTSTSPESLAKIARERGDKPTDAVAERVKDPAAMKNFVDNTLYPKTQAKLTEQGKPAGADNVYREIAASSGRPNPAWNAKALERSALAEKIKVGGKVLGRLATAVGVVTDGLSLAREVKTSAKTGNYDNSYREGARIAGGWTGAWAAGQLGASTGAVIGGALGSVVPILGNGVGAAVGGIIGGLIGGVSGYMAGEQAGKVIYNQATSQR